MVAASELPINIGASAMDMANAIMGDGVSVVGASYSGSTYSSGTYSNGNSVSPGATPGDTGVILSTGRVRDYTNSNGQSNHSTHTSTNTGGQNNNAQFNAAAGTNTYDASYMTIDFIPTGDVMTMQFVFSSEEFPEYQGSLYQDFVGVWINGTQVDMAVGNGDIDPGNISNATNENLYLDNTSDAYNTEMDGLTITMTLTIPVTAGQVNTIQIGVADVSDSQYDSNLLIAGDSVQTELVAMSDGTYLGAGVTKTIDVLGNDINNGTGALTITHINGQAVNAGSTITLATGQSVTLNADGTLTLVSDGTAEDFNFTYTVENDDNSDVGFVNVSSVPCFVAGTMIETVRGPVAVEDLVAGDRILTHDNGLQPLRWIGRRVVPAEENFAPIFIAARTFGDHDDLLVSPQHRILINDALAELLFEEAEVLVSAKDLVNGASVRVIEGGMVEYVHILFDTHEVVFSQGLATESFLPGPQTTASLEKDIVDEICALFPELNPETGDGYSPAARRVLKGYEARVLLGQVAA